MRPEDLKNQCQKHIFFLISIFRVFAPNLDALGPQVGAKLVVLGSQDGSKSHRNPLFWAHVSKMLPKRFQSEFKRGPKEGPEVDFERTFD